MANFMNTDNLPERISELWQSGRQILWLVGDELSSYEGAAKQALKLIMEKRKLTGKDKPVRVVAHDRWAGFHVGLPDIPQCKDKTNILGNAIQIAIMSSEQIRENFDSARLPFDPEEDIIFMFKAVDEEIKGQPPVLTLIRDIMQCNMCSPTYVEDSELGQRGTRMLIFVTATSDLPATLPELKPEVVPLPGHDILKNITLGILEGMWERYEKTDGAVGLAPWEEEDVERVANALCGMTGADAEETLALCIVRNQTSYVDIDEFLETIENEKAKVISKIPGLRYLPKSDIVPRTLPGYELLERFVNDRLKINHELAKKHGITPIRGLTLGGAPGCGKTEVAKYLSRLMGRICLIWEMGSSKGSLVGQSEQATRQVIQIARAMRALVLCDDVDKGGISASKSYSGDGGTTGNMVQMLLTEMSDPFSEAVYVFTFNRVPDLPELMRPGRVDRRFMVVRPNGPTRLAILKEHIQRVNMKVDDQSKLAALAEEHTRDWTGAELAHVLVKEEVVRVLAEEGDTLNVDRMIIDAKGFVPMVKQKAFAEDIRQMEEACSQFSPIGNIPDAQEPAQKSGWKSLARRTTNQ